MKIKLFFKWFDFWIGFFFDRPGRAVYICPIPMFGVKISWGKPSPIAQFNKAQTRVATRLLVLAIAYLAQDERTEGVIDDLSIILAVLHRCHEAAPEGLDKS